MDVDGGGKGKSVLVGSWRRRALRVIQRGGYSVLAFSMKRRGG